jgi:cytochrome P450
MTAHVPTVDFDPLGDVVLSDLYPYLDELRERHPVAYSPALDRWLIGRHADVFAAQRDPRLGRSFRHLYTAEQVGVPDRDPRWSNFWRAEQWSLLELEPPDHDRIRGLISAVFTPKRVAGLRQPAEARAHELLAGLRDHAEFDLLTDYAMPYSVSIICELLGADRAHEHLFLDWAHAMVEMYEVATSEDQARAAEDAAGQFLAGATDLIDYKRAHPADDLVSALVNVRAGDERLSDDEIVSTIIVLLNAGHEATVNTTGNGVTALLTNPEQWGRLLREEVPARQALEELIRWDPPLQLFERWVLTDDVEIAGVPVPFGARIAMLYGAANQDHRVFDKPRQLDLTRENASQHVNFGGGVHACLGAPLARVELEASLRSLARLCPHLRLVRAPRRRPTFVLWGMESVAVTNSQN